MTATDTAAPWRQLHRVADANVHRFVDPFIQSVHGLRRRVSLTTIEESVVKGTLSWELANAIDTIKVAKADSPEQAATKVYANILVDAVAGQVPAELVGRLDVVSPFVQRAAQTLTANLIREVSTESKAAVRRIIFNAVTEGTPPREAAKLIRMVLGLTSRQALAVDRLRKAVFDDSDDILLAERRAAAYSERLLRDRALNVARTETMLAANRGQQLLWTEAQGAGLLPPDFGQRWLTTPDDRLCSRCAPMNGKTVQLGYLFRETERGVLPSKRQPVAGATVVSPPLHPRCRCVLVAVDDLG